MYAVAKKGMWVLTAVAAVSILTGCTNWKKKYQGLNVEHQNLKGLYESTAQERAALAQQLAQEKALVDELQRQIAEGKKTPAQATGFEGFDTKFDAAAGTITVTLQDMILFDPGKADLWITAGTGHGDTETRGHGDPLQLVRAGQPLSYSEEAASAIFAGPEITVAIKLGLGDGQATVWTCDLSHDYVSINGHYRT